MQLKFATQNANADQTVILYIILLTIQKWESVIQEYVKQTVKKPPIKQSLNKILGLLAFYEINEAGTLFELALWKAMIDQEDNGVNPASRAACHVKVPEAVKVTILQYLFCGY